MAFAVFSPSTIEEALELLKGNDGETLPLAGGTNLLVDIRRGKRSPRAVVELSRITELSYFKLDGGALEMGPCVTHAFLADNANLDAIGAKALRLAAGTVGSPQIRNRGTVGGNLQNASPAADAAVALLALDASLTLSTTVSSRRVPLSRFFTGPGRTAKTPEELITGISFPLPGPSAKSVFIKVGKRNAMAVSVVSLAVLLQMSDAGVIRKARIALGAVAPTPVRAVEAERVLQGREFSEALIAEAAEALAADIAPISDIRATAEYRSWLSKVLLRRALARLWTE